MVGEVFLSDELGEFVAQIEDLTDELAVVVFAATPDCGKGGPYFFAERIAVGVGHDGYVAGGLQGETPTFCALLLRALAGGVECRFWQARQLFLIGDYFLPCVRAIEAVLGIFLGELGELALDFASALLLFRREVGSSFTEIGESFFNVAPFSEGEVFVTTLDAVGFELLPEGFVEWDAGEEFADFRQHGVVCCA